MSTSPPAARIKAFSEKKREREVLQYVAAYRDLPRLNELSAGSESSDLPADHIARASTDSTLTALCQLAALRLNAQRALISLIDDTYQHVLAEATSQTALRKRDPSGPGTDSLWLGSVSIPRNWGVCEQVLILESADIPAHEGASVIIHKDLLNSEQDAQRGFVQGGIRHRFYAGAALVNPRGAVVGALCVFDDEPRPAGVPVEDASYLEDLAATIVEYLGNYTVRDRFVRGEKLTRGLISFAEGSSTLLPLDDTDRSSEPRSLSKTPSGVEVDAESSATPGLFTETHNSLQMPQLTDVVSASLQVRLQEVRQQWRQRESSTDPDTLRADSTRSPSLRALQESILPMNSRSMFSRAANVMLSSSDLDGVLILDASGAATGYAAAPERGRRSVSLSDSAGTHFKTESSDESSSHGTKASKDARSASSRICGVLGVAPPGPVVNADGTLGTGSFTETNLARLLREYPSGKVFHYSTEGISMPATDDSSSQRGSQDGLVLGNERARLPHRRRREYAQRSLKAIKDMLPRARSVAFVPLWDYERSRWFAGCLCWTDSPDRLLSDSVDLAYFNIFSHSIMREISRLDAIVLNQQRTTFVASISHELRSPLHGILGTLEFLRDTSLDIFQTSMLNSLNSCGQTLLDTINQVMDHSKLSETTKSVSTRQLKDTNTVRLSSKPLKTRRIVEDPAFDLSIATEEVIEAVFAGNSLLPILSSKKLPLSPPESTDSSAMSESSDITSKRKTFYIILDMDHEQDWTYCFPIGSWKRAVMKQDCSLFGNAIKYTETGYVTVSLDATDVARTTGSRTTITLTIIDTGIGMSPAFLANKAFQPFTQENPHATGVGLGLSIVRQIIETHGGKIEISSDNTSGTKITIKLSLIKPKVEQLLLPQHSDYLSWLPRLKGRKVCILHRIHTDLDAVAEPHEAEGLAKFTQALTKTLSKHLKMNVIQTSTWEGIDCDLFICSEPSFDYLNSIRERRANIKASKAAMTILVALDALEAATLRSDVRVQSKESVVEIMCQPLGPFKLANVLNRCLDRFEHPDENIQHTTVPTATFEGGLHSEPPQVQDHSRHPPFVSSPISSLDTAKMPPLLHQPHWHATEKIGSISPASQETQDSLTWSAETSTVPECALPVRALVRSDEDTGAPLNILITDDNAINRRLLVAFMNRYKHQYAEVENGLEAVRAHKSRDMRFDVILMDMSMPVMDGVTATRKIREYEHEHHIPQCHIIALTGLTSASAKLEAWNAGIDHFMTKPVNFKALEKLLKKAKLRARETVTRAGGRSSSTSSTDS